MDIRQLRYFCTIVEEKQITKAAKTLHIAQPPLSNQLKSLEKELGVVLINREGKQWQVTEAGTILYNRAKKVINYIEETKKELSEIKNGVSGTIHIGTSSICVSHLTPHINRFHQQYPNVYLKIWHGDTHYLEELLQQNKIDVALLLLPVEKNNYDIIKLDPDPFVVVAPHSWAHRLPDEKISMEEVAQYDFLMGKRTSGEGMFENIIGLFKKNGFHPNVVLDCPDISTILSLVATGMGITIMPKSEIHQAYEDKFKVLSIEEQLFYTEPAVIWLKNQYHSKAVQQLIQLFSKETMKR
jgi:LysR family transcriptional regulator, salicylic acid-responsive activator of bsdBCD